MSGGKSLGMRRVFLWWMVLVASKDVQQPLHFVYGVVRQNRSLKKNRIEHGDYYFVTQPNLAVLVEAETDTNRTKGNSTDDPSESKQQGRGSEKDNRTAIMNKLKGDAFPGGYGIAAKGDEKDDSADDDDTEKQRPEKAYHSPSKNPSTQSKGAKSNNRDGKASKLKKKKKSHDSSKEIESNLSYKQSKLKGEKEEKTSNESTTVKTGKKTTKGKDSAKTGGSSGNVGECASSVASAIADMVPQVTAMNPNSCCNQKGAIAAYLTHATIDSDTPSGLSKFWQEAYDTIAKLSAVLGVCFVFFAAGTADPKELERTMYDTIVAVSTMPDVVSMMVTDPTSTGTLMELVRSIDEDPTLPAIGVFNAGYSNIIVDSIVTGKGRLPYIGLIDEAAYGASAALMTRELLDGATPVPMCFFATEDPQRCYSYYTALSVPDSPPFPCNATSASLLYDIPSSVNAVFAPATCCADVISAVNASKVVVGCQDYDVIKGLDFVTLQPVALQAATAAVWNNFVVQFGMAGAQSFPGLQTLVATDVYSILAA